MKKKHICLSLLFLFIFALLNWTLLEISNGLSLKTMLLGGKRSMSIILLNICTISVILGIVCCITKSIWKTGCVSSLCIFLFSLINYYVKKLHGVPITIYDLKNITTVVDVIDTYTISVDGYVIKLIIVYAVCVCACAAAKFLCHEKVGRWIYAVILICIGFAGFGYHSPNPIKPEQTINWHWFPAYDKYGAVACMYESFVQPLFSSKVIEPKGYCTEAIENHMVQIQTDTSKSEYPDIILILNETFYDLNQIIETETNVDFLKNIYSADDISKGYAIVPNIGGGTNCTEYELLTSNSMYLLPQITPFVNLELEQRPSIVSFLNSIGYHTIGSHAASKANYNRQKSYQDIGFDEIHFEDDFEEKEYIYNRKTLLSDESCYKNMINWIEAAEDEGPVFSYLLTIQNHGGWEENTEELHSVKDKRNYGEYDLQVDEFLSCIQSSDKAWKMLTDYYSKSDRNVIICMVGDHSPSFAEEIYRKGTDGREIDLRKVPFLIWDNFSDNVKALDTISVNYIVPTLLEYAGLPLTSYYQYLSDMKKTIPILTSYGTYRTSYNAWYSLDDKNPYKDILNNYLYMEYYNIVEKPESIRKEWFYLID